MDTDYSPVSRSLKEIFVRASTNTNKATVRINNVATEKLNILENCTHRNAQK
jgi:hypothetical protein